MKNLWHIFIMLCLFSLKSVHAETITLRVGVDEYCPYTCMKSEQKGFVIDILEHILSPHNIKLIHVSASWSRIKAMAKKGSIDLIGAVNQSEVNELGIMRTQASITHFHKGSNAAYFVHKDSKWVYSGRESLKDQHIGIVQGYTYPEPLNSHLKDPRYKSKQIVLAGDQGNQRHIKMLASGRVTVIPSERVVFWYIARQLGLEQEFKDAGVMEVPDGLSFFYIGVVKKDKPLAAQLVRWLDEGIEALKRKDQLKNILQKYGV